MGRTDRVIALRSWEFRKGGRAVPPGLGNVLRGLTDDGKGQLVRVSEKVNAVDGRNPRHCLIGRDGTIFCLAGGASWEYATQMRELGFIIDPSEPLEVARAEILRSWSCYDPDSYEMIPLIEGGQLHGFSSRGLPYASQLIDLVSSTDPLVVASATTTYALGQPSEEYAQYMRLNYPDDPLVAALAPPPPYRIQAWSKLEWLLTDLQNIWRRLLRRPRSVGMLVPIESIESPPTRAEDPYPDTRAEDSSDRADQ